MGILKKKKNNGKLYLCEIWFSETDEFPSWAVVQSYRRPKQNQWLVAQDGESKKCVRTLYEVPNNSDGYQELFDYLMDIREDLSEDGRERAYALFTALTKPIYDEHVFISPSGEPMIERFVLNNLNDFSSYFYDDSDHDDYDYDDYDYM